MDHINISNTPKKLQQDFNFEEKRDKSASFGGCIDSKRDRKVRDAKNEENLDKII
jgi:hypothetical protein